MWIAIMMLAHNPVFKNKGRGNRTESANKRDGAQNPNFTFRFQAVTERWQFHGRYLKPCSWTLSSTLRLVLSLGRPHLVLSAVLEVLRMLFQMLVPVALQAFIGYIDRARVEEKEEAEGVWRGMFYASTMVRDRSNACKKLCSPTNMY
jgi:hypothetical protein